MGARQEESKEGCQYFQKVNIPIQAIGMYGNPQHWYCWSEDITSMYCQIFKPETDESFPDYQTDIIFREQYLDGLKFSLIADPWLGPVLWVRANNADIILSISTGARVLTRVQLPQSLIPSHRPAFDQFWGSEVRVTVLSECDGPIV